MPSQVIVITSPHTPAENLSLLADLRREHDALKVVEQQPGAGFAAAINEGWEMADTERVGLLLSDDWIAPDAVSRCLEHQADIVSTGHRGLSADTQRQLWERIPDPSEFAALGTLEEKASYLSHFFMFNREAVLAVGGVDPAIGLTGADDYDLPWTLLEKGASVALIPEPLYFYRDHRKQRLTLRNQQDQVADLRRVLTKHGLPPAEIDRLTAEKKRWYGVPVHVAIEDPHWYKMPGGEA